MKKITLVTTVLTASFLLTACGGGSTSSISPTNSSTSLSNDEEKSLLFMREEEELARDLYLDIYAAKDNSNRLTIFKKISDNAETKHAKAMRLLLVKYGIDDPSTGARNTYTNDDLQRLYNSLLNEAVGSDDLAALLVGAKVEETDIQDIITYKAKVSAEHTDIISTYDNLLCGSRNHLRSFVKKIESISGKTYDIQLPALTTEVQSILSTPQERCGEY